MTEYYEDETVKNALGLLACWMDGKNITCGDIQNLVKRMQPADVKPVVRGRWEETGGFSDEMIDWVRCSKCGEEAPGFTDDYNFCPHCGADMREGEHD